MKKPRQQAGVGLPEIMISLLLSSLIMTALMNQYINVKHHYIQLQSTIDDAMELQLTGDFMRDSIRQAGFTPCLSLDHLITHNLPSIDVDTELNIHRMSPYFNVMLDEFSSTRIRVTNDYIMHDSRVVLIADCYHAEVQRVINVSNTADGQTVTLANPLAFTYQKPVYVGEWVQERFFIRHGHGLFYQRDNTDELTPLVKTMTLKRNGNLVLVNLGWGDEHQLKLETRIRA